MYGLIVDLVTTCLVLLALGIICYGWGLIAFRLLGISSSQQIDSGTLWLGFAVILAVIEFLHLLVPVDWRMGAFLLGMALLALRSKRQHIQLHNIRPDYFKIILTSIIALIWCLRAMGQSNNFDSGLYHFGSIRWLNEYPIIPGLGNLHWRLALNQSYFGFLSLVNVFPYWNKGYAAGGLFITYLVGLTLIEIGAKQRPAWQWLIGGTLFIYLGYLAGTLPNPSPDSAVGLLEIAIFGLLFRLIENHNSATTDQLKDSVVILSLSAALVTIKLSSVAFASVSGLLVLYLQFSQIHQHRVIYVRILLLISLIACIHIVRGYLLSGAPFFPSTFAGAWQLDWAIPIDLIKFEVDLIYSWARVPGELLPGQVLGQLDWFSGWIAKVSWFDRILFGSSAVLMLLNITLSLKKKASENSPPYLLLYFPLVTAIIFWFFTAPDIRFLGAVPALYLALSIWLFYVLLTDRYPRVLPKAHHSSRLIYWLAIFALCLMSFKLTGLRSVSLRGWTAIPQYPVDIQKTQAGLPVNVSTVHGQCWDAPLPCASIFNGNLHADPLILPWPLSLFDKNRFFYSVKFLNSPK